MWGLLRLLDPDAYGDRCPKKLDLNPTQYRKVAKEQMVDMAGNKLFRPRYPHTLGYELEGKELDLYNAVTNFVSKELAEIRGQAGRGAAGFALTTMQRRLASSVRAIKRTLERRVDRLERALADPGGLPSQPQGLPGRTSSRRTPTTSTTSTRTSCGSWRRRRSRSGCRPPSSSWRPSSRRYGRCWSRPRRPRPPAPSGS